MKKSLGHGVGWSASRVNREDNHAKSASARVLRGRLAGSPWGEARAGRAPRESNEVPRRSKPQPPTWRGVGEEEPRPTAWGGARRALAAKTTTPSPPARACSVGGRPVLHGAKRARAARHGSQRRGHDVSKPQPPTWRGVGEEEPRPTAWGGARRALAAKTTTPSPPARACSVGGRPVLHGAKRARVARHGSQSGDHEIRSRSRRPGEVSVKKSLGQRRGVERVARWPRRQPRQVRQRTRAPWAVGWFSTGRSARGPRATGVKRRYHDVSKPQPPTWRGVGEEEPRPTAWGGARRALAAKTTTPSPPARACSVGGWPVLHGAKRARAARHGSQRRWPRRFEAAAADLARCR